ncbi:MAG: hypothetical protein AAGA62_16500 [Bacteroidota bacterium]
MQRTEFEASLSSAHPPAGCRVEIAALWWLKNRNWQRAHDLIDAETGSDAAWVHALLHRMEGDEWNADYWYAQAGRQRPRNTIGQELEDLLTYFLN